MDDKRRIPPAPLVLGLAGLIPFWALAVAILVHPVSLQPTVLANAVAAYGAIILSFLGGIRWGLAVVKGGTALDYVASVLPSLVAWALVMATDPWRLAGLGLVLIAAGPVDRGLVRRGLAPVWFGRLRLILSSGAGAALLVAALGAR